MVTFVVKSNDFTKYSLNQPIYSPYISLYIMLNQPIDTEINWKILPTNK